MDHLRNNTIKFDNFFLLLSSCISTVWSALIFFFLLFISLATIAQPAFYLRDSISVSIGSSTTLFISGNLEASDSGDSSEIINQGSIQINGNWTNSGSGGLNNTNNGGEVQFNGSSAQQISGANHFDLLRINNSSGVSVSSGNNRLFHTLYLQTGNFSTGDSLILNSNSTRTARIDSIVSGSISGDIIMERFVDSTGYEWRFLTAPVSGATLAQWSDDFIMTGFTGSQFPAFPFNSILFYNEDSTGIADSGYVRATDINNSIPMGEGVQAYIGGGDIVVDAKGAAYTGTQNLPVSFTDDLAVANSNDGWNQVGNPYPSAIDWDDPDWTKSGIDDATYVWDGTLGQYASYSGGAGTNGGSRYIASSQAFFVQANASSPVLRAEEGVKTTEDPDFIESTPTNILRLKIRANNNATDETLLRFHPAASDAHDPALDARKIFSPLPVPSLSTYWTNDDYSILSFSDDGQRRTIPVKMQVPLSGQYQLEVIDIPLEAANCLWLEDLFTGRIENLRDSSSFHFTLSDTTQIARFQIVVGGIADFSTIAPACFGDDAQLNIRSRWQGTNIQWLDLNGQPIGQQNLAAIDSIALSAGTYQLAFNVNGCAQQLDTVTITQPASLSLITAAAADTGSASGSASVLISGGTPPYQLLWNDPLQQTSDTAINLIAGPYTVYITDDNGCIDSATVVVGGGGVGLLEFNDADIQIFPNPVKESLNIRLPKIFQNGSLAILNLVGQEVSAQTFTENKIHLNVRSLPSGTYLLRLTNAQHSSTHLFQKIDP